MTALQTTGIKIDKILDLLDKTDRGKMLETNSSKEMEISMQTVQMVNLIRWGRTKTDKIGRKTMHLFPQRQMVSSHLHRNLRIAVQFLPNLKEILETNTNKEETSMRPKRFLQGLEQVFQNRTTFLLWMTTALKRPQWAQEN